MRATNLNLLPMLQAILKHQNLTRAAEELHLTQSALSAALRRLREHFGDELLVKDGRRFRLTETAQRLAGPLNDAMSQLEAIVNVEPFRAATSSRRFRIATAAGYMTAVMMPVLSEILAEEAPGVSVQIMTANARSYSALRADRIDLIISPKQIVPREAEGILQEVRFEPLLNDPFVCLARADTEIPPEGLTREDYLARPHATFVLDLEVHASLEQWYLHAEGLRQFDRIITSDLMDLPLIAAQSDCVVLVPQSLANIATRAATVQSFPCPLPVPVNEVVSVWTRRRNADPEIMWLRELARRCTARYAEGQ